MIPEFFESIRKEKKRLCQGCDSFVLTSDLHLNCSLPPIYTKTEKCPCLICLVKVTCNKTCKLFAEFQKSLSKNHKRALTIIYKGIEP